MDRRTILAFMLIAVVIFFYDDYIQWLYPQPEPTLEEIKQADATNEALSPNNNTSPPALKQDTEKQIEWEQGSLSTILSLADTTYPEQFVTVETERFRARLTSNGARVVSLKLKPNGRYLKKDIELIPAGSAARPGFQFWTIDGPVATETLSFRLDNSDSSSDIVYSLSGQKKRDVTFVTDMGNGQSLRMVYSFTGDSHTFLCNARGEGLANVWVRDYVDVSWKGGLRYTESDTAQDLTYSKVFQFYTGDVLEDLGVNAKKNEIGEVVTGETHWGAIRTKYFLLAMMPETAKATGGWMESEWDSLYSGKFHPNRLGFGLRLPLEGSSPATAVRIYAGPLDDTILKTVDPTLTETMSWGWVIFEPFSKVILWGLKQLYNIIPNYGICIIIFSVLIKIVIWPLTRKSYQSMSGMQRIQPKIAELKEKYAKDAQRLQKETMKLYKEEGINPMGGCLPVLLQMPLLIALFQVFRSTIEFRGAPFFGWITDLAMPDILFHLPFTFPMYGDHVALLPILMGISTYLQSKSTMTDPNQKMMLYFMPIFMVVIFNNFPSGLTLYYTLFNIWTLVQQKITPPPQAAEKGK